MSNAARRFHQLYQLHSFGPPRFLRQVQHQLSVNSISHWLTFSPTDKAGVSLKTHSQVQAWAPRGQRAVQLPRPTTAERISVLPAVLLEGYIVSIAQPGTVCCLDLENFLETHLVRPQADIKN
jgi:hypothetical protein